MTKTNETELKALGKTTEYSVYYDKGLLEFFVNPQQEFEYAIDIEAPEFTCLCPKTGQPDFATIFVTYSPRERCLESKSFKLYLFSFRNEGAFHEEITNRIARDLFDLLRPRWLEVKGGFSPRGGISFQPTILLTEPESD